MVHAQAKAREARGWVGLGSHVTLDACRLGGMTELGDALPARGSFTPTVDKQSMQ